jgi:hypothetical protein
MKTSYYTVLIRDGAPSNRFESYRIRAGLDWGEFVDRHGIKWFPIYVEDTRKRAKAKIYYLLRNN